MWSIDASKCVTVEGISTVFKFADDCTDECLGVQLRQIHGSQLISNASQDRLRTVWIACIPTPSASPRETAASSAPSGR
jgi:hypothetical protein